MMFMPDKAMVFAAGLGTRMRPLSEDRPKPLIKVAGKALIDYTLDRFASAGLGTAIVNVHHLASQIEEHLKPREAPRVIISDEREGLLGQGGGIAKALPHLGPGPFFIANTDAFWLEGPGDNLRALAARWNPEQMDILLLVATVATSVGVDSLGDFHLAQDGRLKKRAEGEVAPFVYTGIGIAKPGLFEGKRPKVFPLTPFFLEAEGKGRLFGQRLDGLWIHVGCPEAVEEAEQAIARTGM
ncbi:MAG: nucleotidyltransferase family protein [Methylocapsa sp.]|nr:nucleotidyltransferase family protein [Methylocapsa sp.]